MLHHSCVRCRIKKIRCDGASPCAHCVDNQVADECKRVMRKPRSRKSPIDASRGARNVSSASHDSPTHGRGFNRASPYSLPSQSPRQVTRPASINDPDVSSFGAQSTGTPAHTLAASDTSSVLDLDLGSGSRSTRVSSQLAQRARETIGDFDVARRMIEFHFYYRCASVIYSCIHLPTLQATLRRLYFAEASDALGEDELAVVLLAIAMSIQFAPQDSREAEVMPMCQELGESMTPRERQRALHALALPLLQRLVFSSMRARPLKTLLQVVETVKLGRVGNDLGQNRQERGWKEIGRIIGTANGNHVDRAPCVEQFKTLKGTVVGLNAG